MCSVWGSRDRFEKHCLSLEWPLDLYNAKINYIFFWIMHFSQFNDFSISFLFQINKYVEVNVFTDSDRSRTLSQDGHLTPPAGVMMLLQKDSLRTCMTFPVQRNTSERSIEYYFEYRNLPSHF